MFHNKSRKKTSKKKPAAKSRASRIRIVDSSPKKAAPTPRKFADAAAPAVVALVADSINRIAQQQLPGRDNWRRIYRYNKRLVKETGMSKTTVCRARRQLVKEHPDTYRQVGHSLYVKCGTTGTSGT